MTCHPAKASRATAIHTVMFSWNCIIIIKKYFTRNEQYISSIFNKCFTWNKPLFANFLHKMLVTLYFVSKNEDVKYLGITTHILLWKQHHQRFITQQPIRCFYSFPSCDTYVFRVQAHTFFLHILISLFHIPLFCQRYQLKLLWKSTYLHMFLLDFLCVDKRENQNA